MKWYRRVICGFMVAVWYLGSIPASAETLKVAVAANFTAAIKKIAARYEVDTGDKILLAFGSTGKHYAQIENGAPFDLFLAADDRRPMLLEREKRAVPGSRYTYALGRIVLWSPKPGVVDDQGAVLKRDDLHFIAIANPKLAPYGQAAREVLDTLDRWNDLQAIIVKGENISQTFQYVVSGNAEVGFIAYSQIKQPGRDISGSYWEVPQSMYRPIEQQLVILKDSPAAWDFWHYLKGKSAADIIRSFGYEIP